MKNLRVDDIPPHDNLRAGGIDQIGRLVNAVGHETVIRRTVSFDSDRRKQMPFFMLETPRVSNREILYDRSDESISSRLALDSLR